MHCQFDYFCSVGTYDIFFFTRLVKVHREYSPAAHILHTKFDKVCDVIFMVTK